MAKYKKSYETKRRLTQLGNYNPHAGKHAVKKKIKDANVMISYEAEAKRRGVPISRVIAEALTNE